MLLTDLGRWVDQRLMDSRPRLTDLPWAQNIEKYADIILLVYRPAHHRIYVDDTDNSTVGKGEIIIAKNRGKEVGRVVFKHNKGMSRIEDAGDGEQV
jgi:replicative DNA helicase